MEKNKVNFEMLLIFILSAFAVSTFANLFSGNSASVYEMLVKPPLSPPQVVFPIVWSVLYLAMAFAAYMVNTEQCAEVGKAIKLYFLQLAVNGVWSIIFFTLEMRFAAFLWLVLLIYLVVLTTKEFYKVNKAAAYLMLPYIIWLFYAAYLNLGFWLLNK